MKFRSALHRLPVSVRSAALALASAVIGTVGPAAAAADEKVEFNRDVRPILSDTCFACHGFDKNARKADLRLDVREDALAPREGGKRPAPVVPGDPGKSGIWQHINSADPEEVMPPPESKLSLTAQQKDVIRRWIEQGAEYQPHWAFVPVKQPAVPQVTRKEWVRNEIDAFVLARLENEGLAPAAESDPRALIRRLSLDLTGLPPTPQEVEAFVADKSTGAYEKLVDRLLASPHYGEKMAIDWLDAARYADTHGFNNDTARSMWRWRDWVIGAFNANQPYDRFLTEQLAGDLLPEATLEQKVATGFCRNNVANSEGGIIAEEYRIEYVADRAQTAAAVFMGLTLACARCHDHKFDPITQREYYQLFAYFDQLQEPGEIPRDRDPDPVVKAPTAEQQAQIAVVRAEVEALEKTRQERVALAERTQSEWEAKLRVEGEKGTAAPADGLIAHWTFDETSGDAVIDAVKPERRGKVAGKAERAAGKLAGGLKFDGATHADLGDVADFERTDRYSYGAWVFPETQEPGTIVARMDDATANRGHDLVLAGGKPEAHLIHAWPNNALRVEAKQPLAPGAWHHVFVTYDGSGKAAGLKIYVDGQPKEVVVTNDTLTGTSKAATALNAGRRSTSVPFKGVIDDVRIYGRDLSPGEVQALVGASPIGGILAVASPQRTKQQQDALRLHYLDRFDPQYRELAGKIDAARKRETDLTNAAPTVMVMQDMTPPRPTFVLTRGEYDKPAEQVTAAVPAVLPPMPAGAPANRLGLAQWLVQPSHPLTARVAVNRYWQMYFGLGLVKTQEDFGLQGELPTHPELLDWLADRFVQSGWDVKAMQRLIVTSATYRQAARYDDGLIERDPENRLLARGPRFRLPAEVIRDNALAVSGLLVDKVGGPSVYPYHPPGLYEDVVVGANYPGTTYTQDHGEGLYRRSMYTFWKRTVPPPSLNTFDAPEREFCTIRRPQTNTPLQALVLMNDPTYVEASRKLAERMVNEAGGPAAEQRLAHGFRLATARSPSEAELKVLKSTFDRRLAHYRANPEAAKALLKAGESPVDAKLDPTELAAYTTVASMILNLDETITKG